MCQMSVKECVELLDVTPTGYRIPTDPVRRAPVLEKVEELLSDKSNTTRSVAKMFGVSKTAISKWRQEKERANPEAVRIGRVPLGESRTLPLNKQRSYSSSDSLCLRCVLGVLGLEKKVQDGVIQVAVELTEKSGAELQKEKNARNNARRDKEKLTRSHLQRDVFRDAASHLNDRSREIIAKLLTTEEGQKLNAAGLLWFGVREATGRIRKFTASDLRKFFRFGDCRCVASPVRGTLRSCRIRHLVLRCMQSVLRACPDPGRHPWREVRDDGREAALRQVCGAALHAGPRRQRSVPVLFLRLRARHLQQPGAAVTALGPQARHAVPPGRGRPEAAQEAPHGGLERAEGYDRSSQKQMNERMRTNE